MGGGRAGPGRNAACRGVHPTVAASAPGRTANRWCPPPTRSGAAPGRSISARPRRARSRRPRARRRGSARPRAPCTRGRPRCGAPRSPRASPWCGRRSRGATAAADGRRSRRSPGRHDRPRATAQRGHRCSGSAPARGATASPPSRTGLSGDDAQDPAPAGTRPPGRAAVLRSSPCRGVIRGCGRSRLSIAGRGCPRSVAQPPRPTDGDRSPPAPARGDHRRSRRLIDPRGDTAGQPHPPTGRTCPGDVVQFLTGARAAVLDILTPQEHGG